MDYRTKRRTREVPPELATDCIKKIIQNDVDGIRELLASGQVRTSDVFMLHDHWHLHGLAAVNGKLDIVKVCVDKFDADWCSWELHAMTRAVNDSSNLDVVMYFMSKIEEATASGKSFDSCLAAAIERCASRVDPKNLLKLPKQVIRNKTILPIRRNAFEDALRHALSNEHYSLFVEIARQAQALDADEYEGLLLHATAVSGPSTLAELNLQSEILDSAGVKKTLTDRAVFALRVDDVDTFQSVVRYGLDLDRDFPDLWNYELLSVVWEAENIFAAMLKAKKLGEPAFSFRNDSVVTVDIFRAACHVIETCNIYDQIIDAIADGTLRRSLVSHTKHAITTACNLTDTKRILKFLKLFQKSKTFPELLETAIDALEDQPEKSESYQILQYLRNGGSMRDAEAMLAVSAGATVTRKRPRI